MTKPSISTALVLVVTLAATVQTLDAQSRQPVSWVPPESLLELPVERNLPELFTFADGGSVRTAEQWETRRQELKQILLYYQYGSMPPRPERVRVVASRQEPHASRLGTVEHLTLEIDANAALRFRAVLYAPLHDGRRPVIIREEGRIGFREEAPMFLKEGYIFVEYARHDLDPDRDREVGPAQAAYPNHDWATLAVWAWCGMRLVDYLETRDDVDVTRIGITGHSRGGKMALLAGALDERFSLVVPHQSGAGGAGSYRVLGPGAETLAHNDKPHWYHERIRWFGEREERLPLDQHFLKALVAPRALLCTESVDDEFANPLGSLVTSVAAQEVYELLGAPDKNAIHFRRGGHSTEAEDWKRVLEFAEWQFFGRQPANLADYWPAEFSLPTGYDLSKIHRKLVEREPVDSRQGQWDVPPSSPVELDFTLVSDPGNPPDRNYHNQGRFGSVESEFEVSTHKVSHIDYAKFLNSVARDDPAGLYHSRMAEGRGAIVRESGAHGWRYLVRGEQQPVPVTNVSWFDAVRFCNWLHHGQPVGPQGPESTEEGAYSLEASPGDVRRSTAAEFFLPTENQWYKAAYYVPEHERQESYIHFFAGEPDHPIIIQPQPERVSPWAMAQIADKVWEWTDSPVGELHRAVRSAAWFLGNNKQSAGHFYCNPTIETKSIGFRIARPPRQ